jgi:fucose permease
MPRTFASRFESLPATPFYFGFVLCGLATCLLGPILPVLSGQWPLNDVQGGWLFAAQFAASTCGSVVSSYAPRRSIATGFAAIAAGMVLLTVGHYRTALGAVALIGVGFGAAVSATNLIFGTEYPERRGVFLARVNLCWGVGAVLAALLVALAVRADAVRALLLLLALCALLLFVVFAPLLKKRSNDGAGREGSAAADSGSSISLHIFVLFSVLLFLYVGAETSVAGWVATYAHRLNGLSVERASLFVSAFWLAVVAGRGAAVWLLHALAERVVLVGGLVLAIAGVVALLLSHGAGTAFAAVVVAGLGFAPVFPLLLARMLARTGRSRRTGWIFAICGSGGAVVPWITGMVSGNWGGLRGAFWVSVVALAGVALCVLIDSSMPQAKS